MDKGNPARNGLDPGLSLRNGPLEEMDIDDPPPRGGQANGHANNNKRKARQVQNNSRSYKEASTDEDDDKPLVRTRGRSFRFGGKHADNHTEQAPSDIDY